MPDSELVEEVEATLLRHDPVVSTGAELSRELDESKPAVLEALRILEYNDAAESASTGANAVAWWHAERVVPAPPEDPAEHPDQSGFEDHAPREPRVDQEASGQEVAPGAVDGADPVADLEDIPGSGALLERRRDALRDLYAHLKMNETSRKSEFIGVLEHADHGYQDGESAWSNLVKGRETLATLPGVESPAEGEHRWRYDP